MTNEHAQLPQVQLRNVNIHYEFPEVLPQMLVRTGDVKQQVGNVLAYGMVLRFIKPIREQCAFLHHSEYILVTVSFLLL